jgi:hypothetical protein
MSDDLLRAHIDRLLADGLPTEWRRRAYAADEVVAVCRHLQDLRPDDVESKLVMAGFTASSYVDPDDADGIEQSCATCMYFERHRKFCALPELMLPAEPQWSCILWRI